MIPRRFINLMMKDSRVRGSYWLSRLRPEENLFYASAREAVASETQARRESRKPTCASTMELPSPEFRFKSSRSFNSRLSFMPFYGVGAAPRRAGSSRPTQPGTPTCTDADEVSCEMLPPTNESSNWHSPISVCIAKDDAIHADALYIINSSNSTNFRCLAYCNGKNSMAWKWLWLPPPPYILGQEDRTIESYTLLQDNKTICFSSVSEGGGFGTYCFDTANLEWTKAGSWTLPFYGRALCVPHLYNLHFGFHDSNHEDIVALDLPSPLDVDAPPKVLYRWRRICQSGHLGQCSQLMDSNLLYLGNHRFCAAKVYGIFDESVELDMDRDDMGLVDMAVVLTGMEIVNGKAKKAKLRMIKHKTITYFFRGCSVASVL